MSRFTSFLSAAFTKIVQSDGTELPRRKKVNFVGCTIADNPTEERTDITPPGVGGGEANTNSNVGTGVGELVKSKVGVDTPIKTLAKAVDDLIAIANGTNEVTFSIPNVGIGTGDPNGSRAGTLGNVFIRTDVPTIYQNTDGATAWAAVGGAGAGDPYNATPETNTAATGAAGAVSEYARGDHRHQISVGSPVAVAAANADGVSTAVARADHAHAHGDQGGGSLHAVATPSASEVGGTAGFLSAIDKEKVDVLTIDGDGLSYLANDGTYKVVESGSGGISTLAVWSPGITDDPPFYGTLAAALTAVKSQPGPAVILLHPTTASAFATVASTTYDFDSRVSLYSINNRTLTFGNSAPLINFAEVGCLQDGFRLTLADGGSATGTRLLEISSNLIRPHIFNVTKSGTSRRLVQFTGGTAAAERGITIGRNVTTAMAGDIYSDGKTAVTLRRHGQSFVAGVVQNSSAHGNNLEVIYEDAQNVADATMTSSWSTGAASSTYRQDHGHQTGLGDDDHAGYWWTAGRSGNKTYYGSTSSGAFLQIQSTSHGTLGPVNLVGSYVTPLGQQIKVVGTCTDGTDAANKDYVDGFWNTAGVAGNRTYNGSNTSGSFLQIQSTSHATKGPINLVGSYVSTLGTQIKSIADPTAAQDAATKAYVDGLRAHGEATNNTLQSVTGPSTAAFVKIPGTTSSNGLLNMSAPVSNRLQNTGASGFFEIHASVEVLPDDDGIASGVSDFRITIGYNGVASTGSAESSARLAADEVLAEEFGQTVHAFYRRTLNTNDYVEAFYFGHQSSPRRIRRFKLSAVRLA